MVEILALHVLRRFILAQESTEMSQNTPLRCVGIYCEQELLVGQVYFFFIFVCFVASSAHLSCFTQSSAKRILQKATGCHLHVRPPLPDLKHNKRTVDA